VTRNEKGDAETVRHETVNAMLLNEFLKEHRKVENSAAYQIQRMSAHVKIKTRAPRVVGNN